MSLARLIPLAIAALALSACGDGSTTKEVSRDAGFDVTEAPVEDAGADVGGNADAGGTEDVGSETDLGGPTDMGRVPDMAPPSDASTADMPPDMPSGQCGNGIIEGGEQCDDGNDDEADACASDCTLTCGNGVLGTNEQCDTAIPAGMPGACPTSCDDGDACTTETLQGTDCEATCVTGTIAACIDADGCCPSTCDANDDDDCSAMCGNGAVEPNEACDGNCPTTCDDQNACTADSSSGSAATCDVMCTNAAITACTDADGCCPAACDATNDDDCSASCGNGTVEAPETCDGNCPTSCDDGNVCTTDSLQGSAGQCNATCVAAPITACSSGDGCCPSGCTTVNDTDCQVSCGNGAVEQGEECDDGNTTPGDGCDASCMTEAITFRMTDLDIMDPHVYADLPFFGCTDITNSVPLNLAPSVNQMLEDAIQCDGDCGDAGDDDGELDLSFALQFDPLVQGHLAMGSVDVMEATCTAPADSTTCGPGGFSETANYASDTMDACLAALPNTTRPYSPAVPVADAPCFATETVSLTIDVGGILIPLTDVTVGGTWVGTPATSISDGLLRGFLSEADADAIIIPSNIAIVGGEPLSSVLPGGTNACARHSDLDVGPDGTTPGWWFYLSFPAEPVPYTP